MAAEISLSSSSSELDTVGFTTMCGIGSVSCGPEASGRCRSFTSRVDGEESDPNVALELLARWRGSDATDCVGVDFDVFKLL